MAWKLEQWNDLKISLKTFGFFHYPEQFRSLRLAGRRPEDACDDLIVATIMVDSYRLHPTYEQISLLDWFMLARNITPGKPMYVKHMDVLQNNIWEDEAMARDELNTFMDMKITRLTDLNRDVLDPLDARDREEAGLRALIDDSPEGERIRRYESACERELHRSITELVKLRKASEKLRTRDEFEPAAPTHLIA